MIYNDFTLSQHARIRMQQRGISFDILEWICSFGEEREVVDGYMLFFGKKALQQLKKDLGSTFPKIESQIRNTYLIINGRNILTVGHRYKKVRRI